MSRDKTTTIVWAVTGILVVFMLGAAVYISIMNAKKSGDAITAPVAVQELVQTDKVLEAVVPPSSRMELAEEKQPKPEPRYTYEPKEIETTSQPESIPVQPTVITDEQREADINRLAAEKRARKLQDTELDLSGIAGQMSVKMKLVGYSKNKFMLRYTCYRNNISPPISWSGVPEGTRSFVVMMDRVDEGESPVPYWILFNIPADTEALPEKVSSPQSGDMRYGANNFDKPEYMGPCDPKDKHKYRIRVFALDTILNEPVGVSRTNMIRAMRGHILDVGELNALHYM